MFTHKANTHSNVLFGQFNDVCFMHADTSLFLELFHLLNVNMHQMNDFPGESVVTVIPSAWWQISIFTSLPKEVILLFSSQLHPGGKHNL